jgi:ribosomal protein S18 acetylase RimI-like enzyme
VAGVGEVSIRAARAGDVAAVLAVWAIARSAAAMTPDSEEAIEALLARDGEALLVAEVEGTVVGVLIAGFDGWRGNLYRLAVLPPFRRRGVAAALVRHAEERLRVLGCLRVTALVGMAERDAVEFWDAVGYARDRDVGRLVRFLS